MSITTQGHSRELRSDLEPGGGTALAVGSVLAALGSVGYIAMNFHSGSPREVYALPLSAATSAVATVGLVILSLAVATWRVDLPHWARTLTSAGLIMTAATSWFFATGVVAIAEQTDDKAFDELGASGWILAMTIPKMVMCLVGFSALAVAGWRNHALPRLTSVALIIGALLSLIPPFPPGVVFAAAGFLLASRSSRLRNGRRQ